jgi:hypothetical protein
MEIRIKFKKSTHELSVSTFAGIVLLLFDGQDENRKFSYEVCLSALVKPLSPSDAALSLLECRRFGKRR